MMSRIGAGMSLRSMLAPADPAGTWIPAAASPSTASSLTRLPRMAPRTETPMAPPTDRKNATEALAVPMSLAWTVFWTARTRFCISRPRPRPRIAV